MFPNSYFSSSYFPESYFPPVEALTTAHLRGLFFWDDKKRKKKARTFRPRFREEIERVLNETLEVKKIPFSAPKEVREAAEAVKKPFVADVTQQITLARYLQSVTEVEQAERIEKALMRWAFDIYQQRLEQEREAASQALAAQAQANYEQMIARELVSLWYERQKKVRQEQDELDLLLLFLLTEEL
jgi:hypothetical protein